MRLSSLTLFFFSLLFISCTNDAETYKKIVGEWTCTSWVPENSSTDKCNNNAYFEFNADKTYRSKLGGEEDKGTYKIERGKLLAQPEGKMVIGVKIMHIDENSMELLMNNGGIKETLKLKRQ